MIRWLANGKMTTCHWQSPPSLSNTQQHTFGCRNQVSPVLSETHRVYHGSAQRNHFSQLHGSELFSVILNMLLYVKNIPLGKGSNYFWDVEGHHALDVLEIKQESRLRGFGYSEEGLWMYCMLRLDVPGRSRGRPKILMDVMKEDVKLAGVRMQRMRVKWRQIIGCSHVWREQPKQTSRKTGFFLLFF